jgi:uncharacterized membrane protein
MDVWELLSIASVATVVSLFSGPRAALTKSIRNSTFEVFVEIVDRMNWSLAPALIALLPAAFLSLSLTVLMSYHEFPKLFFLNATALLLLSGALLVAIVFELPIVEEIAAWPATFTIPEDWQRTRQKWLTIHIARIALGFSSLLLLITAGSIYAFTILEH